METAIWEWKCKGFQRAQGGGRRRPGDASECEQTKGRHDPSPIQLRYSRLDSL